MKMNKKSVLSLVLAGSLAFGAGMGSYAWFTSTATSTANTFQAGTIIVDANNSSKNSGSFDIALKTNNIQPGEVLTTGDGGYSTITVKNTGTLNMATFGRFTLADDNDLSKDMLITDYSVDFYREGATTPYRTDNFIDKGVRTNSQFASNMKDWVNGNGPLDIPGTNWDLEAMKPGDYYVIKFKLAYDPNATEQGKTCKLKYEVKTTQVNAGAIKALNLDGIPGVNGANYIENSIMPYFNSQLQ